MSVVSAVELASSIYRQALSAVRADVLVQAHLRVEDGCLNVDGHRYVLRDIDRVLLLAVGKAAVEMAWGAQQVLGKSVAGGLVITKRGYARPLPNLTVLEAGHPIPDASSLEAGTAALRVAEAAGPRDLFLCLLSGGASALMEALVPSVSLDDLQAATRLLLCAGAPIEELNAVRGCLSSIKLGGLARAAAPAQVACLALSDVLGNRLDVIGSGPCYPGSVSGARAIEVLERRHILEEVPAKVVSALRVAPERGQEEPPTHVIVGDIWTALEAAQHTASGLGLSPCVLTGRLEGEAREVGHVFGAVAGDLVRTAGNGGPRCFLAGGETTVTVRGSGDGGRCQELAVAASASIVKVEGVAVLAAGTDGSDGPTNAAGGLVDGGTLARARERGWTVECALSESSSHSFLEAAGDLVVTGPTGSNVGDLVIVTVA